MLVNADGKVFVGRRIDTKEGDWWQMPQGGVDKGEDLEPALWRELHEETGVTRTCATLIKKMADDIAYDLPEDLMGKLWGGKYRGQVQSWYLLRFTGSDADIDLEAHDPPEFCDWKWVDPEDLPGMIIPFKKRVYRTVLEAFRDLI
ncbi:RNA pyrophosphohydrolase [Altererythrobacter sediminis]|uniref:RNA pyrophosphohydrolase n=2 Tax=Allopontixanthobacter sediminis TaxID=1689985 RepID=A0A845AZY3_9SPHN|nr:RNA pyrophosphohydrolase [Allopontixanthobacter sediminis]